jgi:multidrug efflux pump subunit AcrA (membrane-fusion protein)
MTPIDQLRQQQKAALLLPDKKQGRAEYDRLAEEIATARYEQAVEATQAEASAEEARKQADIALRQRNAATLEAREASIQKLRTRHTKIVDAIRQLSADIKQQRADMLEFNPAMSGLDGRDDYSRHATDYDNGFYQLLEFHQMPRGGHASREEPVQPMLDALDRLAARIGFVRARAKL